MAQVHQDASAAPAASHVEDQESENVVTAATSLGSAEVADGGVDEAPAAAAQQWQRVRWTREMVKLLVSALSYLDEDMDTDDVAMSRRSKQAMLKRNGGKWKLASSAMTKWGFPASPQQCEDKFNDMNKRYKRVTEILGRGTACGIVERPEELEQANLSADLKEEARRFLRSSHLHYEEMCNYHNHTRFFLLDDPDLKKWLRAAVRGQQPGEQGKKSSSPGCGEDDDNTMLVPSGDGEDDGSNDDVEASAEDGRHHGVLGAKKLKHGHEGGDHGPHLSQVIAATAMDGRSSEGTAAQKNSDDVHAVQIETERLEAEREVINGVMQKLEEKHVEWVRASKEEDREVQRMRLENERMELENKRLELELKIMEIQMGVKPKSV